jgi:D-sedoheptulose 7-phosphate isomerase
MLSVIEASLDEHLATINLVREQLQPEIAEFATKLLEVLQAGGKLLICGNGGSAADAQHFAAELVGRFEQDRQGLPAIALTTDTSVLTASGNDFGFSQIFSRQVEALAVSGDAIIGISTSGNSENISEALLKARELGCITCGLTGCNGGRIAGQVDTHVNVPVTRTARVQEAHQTILHIVCELIETELLKDNLGF